MVRIVHDLAAVIPASSKKEGWVATGEGSLLADPGTSCPSEPGLGPHKSRFSLPGLTLPTLTIDPFRSDERP